MNLSLYSGATGMQAQQLNLNVISNNIANVNTTGYKKNKIEFQDLLYQNPRQAGGQTGAGNVIPTGVEMGTVPMFHFQDLYPGAAYPNERENGRC